MRHLVEEKRSRVFRAKVDEAIRDLTTPEKSLPRPWEAAIRTRQQQVRKAYVDVAGDLAKGRDDVSRSAAAQLQAFLKNLPPLETERHRLRRELVPVLEGQGRAVEPPEPREPPQPRRDRDRER